MLGVLGVKDVDQLVFVLICRECLKQLYVFLIVVYGIGIEEKMRFMNGDSLVVEFEDGI